MEEGSKKNFGPNHYSVRRARAVRSIVAGHALGVLSHVVNAPGGHHCRKNRTKIFYSSWAHHHHQNYYGNVYVLTLLYLKSWIKITLEEKNTIFSASFVMRRPRFAPLYVPRQREPREVEWPGHTQVFKLLPAV